MKNYIVRKGYVFFQGRARLQGGESFTANPEDVKGQEWKVEEVKPKVGRPATKEVESPEKDRSIKKDKVKTK